jgi:hypothetical protein
VPVVALTSSRTRKPLAVVAVAQQLDVAVDLLDGMLVIVREVASDAHEAGIRRFRR